MGHTSHAACSLTKFLTWEETQPGRNEFIAGTVRLMEDPSRRHAEVVQNLLVALKLQLRGRSCAVMTHRAALRVGDSALFYPDTFVTQDPKDLRTEAIFTAPTLIAEVLSPSTEAYDRGQKFAQYRRLPSLREYVLVSPETREVLLFRRDSAHGLFTLHDFSAAPALECASIGCTVPLADVFEGIDPLPDEPSAEMPPSGA